MKVIKDERKDRNERKNETKQRIKETKYIRVVLPKSSTIKEIGNKKVNEMKQKNKKSERENIARKKLKQKNKMTQQRK